jgi:HPt (histidine-containing phosphotransfer) domain-containing protein
MDNVRELADLFRQESATLLAEIRAGLASGDAKRVQRAGHTLKGSAGIFCAPRVIAAAARFEQLGRDQDLPQAAALVDELEIEVSQLLAALDAALKTH